MGRGRGRITGRGFGRRIRLRGLRFFGLRLGAGCTGGVGRGCVRGGGGGGGLRAMSLMRNGGGGGGGPCMLNGSQPKRLWAMSAKTNAVNHEVFLGVGG